MIDRIIEFSGRNRFVVFVLIGAAVAAGRWWSMRTMPLDAIPDLSDTQVIVYSRWDRSPDIMEDQVTYPITSAMLGAPGVRTVRGFSDFGYSYVYIIFDEGTDIYWARSRTLEYLSAVLPRLPQGVRTELGPDATGVGWVFQYVLVDTSGKHDLAQLRSRAGLVPALPVAVRAGRGGSGAAGRLRAAVPGECRSREAAGLQHSHRARWWRRCAPATTTWAAAWWNSAAPSTWCAAAATRNRSSDLGSIVLAASAGRRAGARADVGRVELGPDIRRGVADLDGKGDAVSGIVVMRQGENALAVIDRVKAKLHEIAGRAAARA